jgi:beta-lactamase class D
MLTGTCHCQEAHWSLEGEQRTDERARESWLKGLIAAFGLLALSACAPQRIQSSLGTPIEQPAGCAFLQDEERSTFVLYEVSKGRLTACNSSRAMQRFTPASTFKIPHALLALDNAVVTDERQPFRWDGRARAVGAWDKDTSLAEAMPASTVWVFQEIADRLGPEREASGLRRLRYGNQNSGSAADLRHFWLSGPLQISAVEQVGFLNRLRIGELDADRQSQARTRALLKVGECGVGCVIYGKTGAMLPIDDEGFLRNGDNLLLPAGIERTGWFVGWVERPDADGGPIVFACNLDLALPGAMAARTAVAYQVLAANGINRAVP